MTKYKLNQIVEFKHKNEVLFGEIIGIRDKDNQECTYCIYNEEYVTHCDTHIMEESDLNSFSDYSIKFVNNINSRAFWKIETNIIGEKLNVSYGNKCSKCKEYNQYIDSTFNYKCWRCTNYPY